MIKKYSMKDLLPPLTDKQYLTARNGGYTAEELAEVDYYWYQDNRHLIVTNKITDPATAKQIAFLSENTDISGEYSYQRARKAIQEIALKRNDDEKYVNLLNASSKKWREQKRVQRGSKKSEPEESIEEEPVVEQSTPSLQEVVIASTKSIIEVDNDEHEETEEEYQAWLVYYNSLSDTDKKRALAKRRGE